MQQYIQTITRHFFKKDDLEQVAIEELEDFVATYPYSSAGHLLLTRKLQDLHAAAFSQQAAVTSLYLTNPLWLHWILDASANNNGAMADPAGKEPFTASDNWHAERTSPSLQEKGSMDEEPIIDEEAPRIFDAWPVEEPVAVTASTAPETEPAEREEVVTKTSFFAEENIPEHASDTGQDIIPTAETINEPFTTVEPPAPVEETAPASSGQEEYAAENADTKSGTEANITTPNPEEQTELTFQSYHTIDYFASQGIRLRQEELLKDRFGQQVKSFTEWLKNMKRIAPSASVEEEESSNASIRAIAEHSFNEKEVITETMAEVWIKQGNNQKAIAVYEKLSLLNPSKSAYFAAKIEQLKAQ